MSEQLQLRAGTATQVAAFTGAAAECVVDNTNNRLVLQDGTTAGGWPAAKLAEVITNTRTAVSDAAYTALTTDRLIAYTAITAPRTVALPASSSYPTGTVLTIVDESGACSPTNAILVAPNGTDVINGVATTPIQIGSPYAYVQLESNQAGKWTVINGALNKQVLVGRVGAQCIIEINASTIGPVTSGSVYTFTNGIPANSLVIGCSLLVDLALTVTSGTPTLELGYTGSPSAFATGLSNQHRIEHGRLRSSQFADGVLLGDQRYCNAELEHVRQFEHRHARLCRILHNDLAADVVAGLPAGR